MTKDEALHVSRVQEMGCIACWITGVYTPAEIHHVLDGNRRLGHKFVLPLCVPHHRGGSDGAGIQSFVSRHPYKKRFEERYGTEQELLQIVEDRLHERYRD